MSDVFATKRDGKIREEVPVALTASNDAHKAARAGDDTLRSAHAWYRKHRVL